MALTRIEIETYKLERGEYFISNSDIGNDIEPWHRIFLLSKSDPDGVQVSIELQFASDRSLENYISQGVGYVSESENKIFIRYRLSEFEPIYNIIRNEKPIFFEYDQFADDLAQGHMRVHTARITTNSEKTGEGPADFSPP